MTCRRRIRLLIGALTLFCFELPSFSAHAAPILKGYPLALPLCLPSGDLQACLNRYGKVRLARATYSIRNSRTNMLVLNSNEAVYGLHGTVIPPILLIAGSKNTTISGISTKSITFQKGSGVSVGNLLIDISADIYGDGARVRRNTFIRILGRLSFDDHGSGYIQQNVFIGCHSHGSFPAISLIGNAGERSEGNVFAWYSFQTPAGTATRLVAQDDLTFAGIGAESWNLLFRDGAWAPLIDVQKSKRVTILGAGFGTASPYKTPFFSSHANENVLINIFGDAYGAPSRENGSPWTAKSLNAIHIGGGSLLSWIFPFSRNLHVKYSPSDPTRIAGVTRIEAHSATSALTENGKLSNWSAISRTERAQILDLLRSKSTFLSPLISSKADYQGSNASDLARSVRQAIDGNIDDADALQAEIDQAPDGIVYLAPGTFFIGHSLTLRGRQGIIGSGSGLTTLVALGDIDMIIPLPSNPKGPSIDGFTLANLALKGGRNGIDAAAGADAPVFVLQEIYMSDVIIEGMSESGFKIDQIEGMDNDFLDNVSFVNNGVGFRQVLHRAVTSGDDGHLNYVDKVVFYENRFINNGVGVELNAGRQDNQNAWINSSFIGNKYGAMKLHNNDDALIVGSEFINNGAEDVASTGIGVFNAPPMIWRSSFVSMLRRHSFVNGSFSGLDVEITRAARSERALLVVQSCGEKPDIISTMSPTRLAGLLQISPTGIVGESSGLEPQCRN